MKKLLILGIGIMLCGAAFAAPPAAFTTQQDRQNMMDQLGIAQLRPGRSPDPASPNAANTDESKANPYPVWPSLMTLKGGQPVTSVAP